MIPTAPYFIAYCPLLVTSLPTGLKEKQQKQKHCSNNFSGQMPTVFAHLPTAQTIEPATVSFSGQDFPYSYGVMLTLSQLGEKRSASKPLKNSFKN